MATPYPCQLVIHSKLSFLLKGCGIDPERFERYLAGQGFGMNRIGNLEEDYQGVKVIIAAQECHVVAAQPMRDWM